MFYSKLVKEVFATRIHCKERILPLFVYYKDFKLNEVKLILLWVTAPRKHKKKISATLSTAKPLDKPNTPDEWNYSSKEINYAYRFQVSVIEG